MSIPYVQETCKVWFIEDLIWNTLALIGENDRTTVISLDVFEALKFQGLHKKQSFVGPTILQHASYILQTTIIFN